MRILVRRAPRPPRWGTLFALLLVNGTLLLLAPRHLRAQLSPGPLARPHATLEGAANCVKCHGLKGESMTKICLQCHTEIAWLMQAKRGLHSRITNVERKECASCHPDHAGADFKMIAWPEGSAARFDHKRAGWTLEGKHADAKCEACHTAKFRVGQAATLSRRRGANGAGWVGLERNCISCHKDDDVHDGKLAAQCETCHDARTWEKAPTFDHDKADYKLDGKHADVACDKCHLTPRLKTRTNTKGERIPLFKPVPYKDCASCHADPHKGRFTVKCSECHVTRGFDIVDKREFNHGLTRYPLKGEHVAVSCAACHGKDMSRKTPSFATCGSCHADAHNGEAKLAGRETDCASCHKVEGFAPATFTIAQHRETKYPLEGKHATVACAACHGARPAPNAAVKSASATTLAGRALAVRFHPSFARCADCHEDVHGGQVARSTPNAACETCHVVAGFSPSTYSRASHARLKLPLEGKHATIACAACHGATRPGLSPWPASMQRGKAGVVLALPDASCTSCHVDPHAGRYPGAVGAPNGCATCHDATSFVPSTVNIAAHAKYALPLEGAHAAVPCVACHQELGRSASRSSLVQGGSALAALPFSAKRGTTCSSCHDTPHGTQFASRADQGKCDACHVVASFVPATRFDHDRGTSFSLKGAHAAVPCAKCHVRETLPNGSSRVVYRPLSSKCESCHGESKGRALS